MINENPLEELVEDEELMSLRTEKILLQILKPYVFITKKTKAVRLRDEAFRLPTKLTLILYFAGKLAAKQLHYIDNSSISQKEIIEFFKPQGIPEGTIKPTLKKLRDERFLSEGSNKGQYLIGLDKIIKVQQEFKKYEKS